MRTQRRPTRPYVSLQDRRTLEHVSGIEQKLDERTNKATAQQARKARIVENGGAVLPGDYIIRSRNATSAGLQLPPAELCAGNRYRIEDESGDAGTNNITVRAHAGETIGGAATQTISANYGTLALRSDGRKWIVE
jgi:hypothetical protein